MKPRYGRRMPEINAAIAAVYLSGGNTRRIRGALAPLLKAAQDGIGELSLAHPSLEIASFEYARHRIYCATKWHSLSANPFRRPAQSTSALRIKTDLGRKRGKRSKLAGCHPQH